jgi:hypothetical protein
MPDARKAPSWVRDGASRVGVVAAILALLACLASPATRAAGLTAIPVSGSTGIFAVACPTSTTCYAAGANGGAGIVASAAQGWQSLAAGFTADSYRIPTALLRGAHRVRIRVVVSDGFSDASATTGLLRF